MIGDLKPAEWRIDIYELKPENPYTGAVTDLSTLYTSDLTIKKERNRPDEIHFTLDLKQLEERATGLNTTSRAVLEAYRHKVLCFRNGEFVAQGIVTRTSVNLNNQAKNTLEVNCVDFLGLFEKRLIHQDYGEGSWADFAKQVVYDAQHEPNRIYNYAWEGDGTGIDNAWFRGWLYRPGEDARKVFKEWEPNHLYSAYECCTHKGKFWEAVEHVFISGEEFTESNWKEIGIVDEDTKEVTPAYGIWREDFEEVGPTGTALGGWAGTSSCHLSGKTFPVNNGPYNEETGKYVTEINMAGGEVSTTLVAPISTKELADGEIYSRVMVRDVEAKYEITDATISTKSRFKEIDKDRFKDKLFQVYPQFKTGADSVISVTADENGDKTAVKINTKNGNSYTIWNGDIFSSKAKIALARWGITLVEYFLLTFNRNDPEATGTMQPIKVPEGNSVAVPDETFTDPTNKFFVSWNTRADGKGKAYVPGMSISITEDTTLFAIWQKEQIQYVLSYKLSSTSQWTTETFTDDMPSMLKRLKAVCNYYEGNGEKYDIKIAERKNSNHAGGAEGN